MCVCVLVTQSCLNLCDPVTCSPPGSSVHGRMLECVASPFSRGSSRPRYKAWVSRIAGRSFMPEPPARSPLLIWVQANRRNDLLLLGVSLRSNTEGCSKMPISVPRYPSLLCVRSSDPALRWLSFPIAGEGRHPEGRMHVAAGGEAGLPPVCHGHRCCPREPQAELGFYCQPL